MILVTGAAGLNGLALVSRLSASRVPVRALVRRPHAGLAALPGVEVVLGDLLQPASLDAALQGVDRAMLISTSSADMVEVQAGFVEAARRARVAHLVKLSGIMPELESPFRFARMHGEIERRIEASGLPFTHLRAGEFMHAYFRQVPAVVNQSCLFLPMEQARIASVDIEDLAEAAACVLTSTGHEGKIYRLTGPEAQTMTEVAEKLSLVTGKTVRYVNVAPDDARKAQLVAGLPPYIADALAELFAERRRGKESQVFTDIEPLLGRRATTFEAFARRHAAIFRGEQPPPKV